jgi:hypothetical protein
LVFPHHKKSHMMTVMVAIINHVARNHDEPLRSGGSQTEVTEGSGCNAPTICIIMCANHVPTMMAGWLWWCFTHIVSIVTAHETHDL